MDLFTSIVGEAIWFGLDRLIEYGLAKKLFSCPMRDQSQMSVYGSNRMVMDGDISPMLISQSTVMDDNKVLTLTNNERIAQTMRLPVDWYEYMANNPRLDVTLLNNRCYVITLPREVDENLCEYEIIMSAFRKLTTQKIATEDTTLFMEFVDDLFLALDVPRKRELEFGKQVCQATVDLKLQHNNNFILKVVQLVELLEVRHSVFIIGNQSQMSVYGPNRMMVMDGEMLCTLLDCLSTSINCPPENAYGTYFVFTCLSAFGSEIFQDQLIDWRVEISKWWLTEFKTIKISSSGSVFNYFIDPEPSGPSLDLVSSFELNPDIHLQQTLVSTIETTRTRYFLNLLVDKKIMLAGADDDILKSLSNDLYAVANVPLNFYTISEMLQKILEKPLEKKAGRKLIGLPDGKSLICFIDDINMPEVCQNLLVDKKITLAGADDDIFKSLSNDLYAVANVPLNFYTISEMLQKILEKPLEKKAGRKLIGLPDGKSLICFIDDINMPEQTLASTIETTRIRYFLNLLVDKKIMLAGADDDILKSLSNDLYAVANVPLNFYTISEMLQKILEKPLEKKAKFLVDGKTLINCIEDINMPEDVSDSCINESAQTRSVGSNIVQKAMKKLPKNLGGYHPVQLINKLLPGIQYYVRVISNPPADILVHCTINELTFVGRAPSKKLAQRQIAVCALAYFYGLTSKEGITELALYASATKICQII